jgi:hypothetical protein
MLTSKTGHVWGQPWNVILSAHASFSRFLIECNLTFALEFIQTDFYHVAVIPFLLESYVFTILPASFG